MKYTRLTQFERWQIEALHTSGKSFESIGKQLGRCSRTINREVQRNGTVHGYAAGQAQRMASNRHHYTNSQRRKFTGWLRELVIEKIRAYWSPQQISGWLLAEHEIKLSHETIYRYIWTPTLLLVKGALVTSFSLVDRASKYTKLALVPNGCSDTVITAIKQCLQPHKRKVRTITFDNGTEFTNHQKTA